MLTESAFDRDCLGRQSYRLTPPIGDGDLQAVADHRRRGPLFVDVKLPAGDIATARLLLQAGFSKVCTQVEFFYDLHAGAGGLEKSGEAGLFDQLSLDPADLDAHAAHFDTSRFRQDHRIPVALANALYRRWIVNSLSGRKRVAAIGRNFCTFADRDGERVIDLLSVLDKRRGYARRLLSRLIADAQAAGLRGVRVVTEVENAASMAAYRQVGFVVSGFLVCLHLWSGDSGPA